MQARHRGSRGHGQFYVEGKGKTTVSRSWPGTAGGDIAKSKAWVQVRGEKQEPVQALGWDAALVGYRPFLTHAELEAAQDERADACIESPPGHQSRTLGHRRRPQHCHGEPSSSPAARASSPGFTAWQTSPRRGDRGGPTW